MLAAPVLLDLVANERAFRVPEDETRSRLLGDGEEIELASQSTMVPASRLLQTPPPGPELGSVAAPVFEVDAEIRATGPRDRARRASTDRRPPPVDGGLVDRDRWGLANPKRFRIRMDMRPMLAPA